MAWAGAGRISVHEAVQAALAAHGPVVALESSVFANGLPAPANGEAARRMVAAVRAAGALPAITAVVGGSPTVGLGDADLKRFLQGEGVPKVSARDIAPAMVHGDDGATTVAAAIHLAHLAGISVFATGGIGGVHRFPPFDESADLLELARTPVIVVCSGAKSILDLRATLERLETLGIAVVGYQTSEFPGFFTRETGLPLAARAESPAELCDLFLAERALGRPGALLVAQAPPADLALTAEEVESAMGRVEARWRDRRVYGGALTPSLLAEMNAETGGQSLAANLALLERNAGLAGEVAAALARRSGGVAAVPPRASNF
jgi:pseudouridine-5'-phosphate glycosidase